MHNRRVQLMKTVDYWVDIVRYSEALEPRLVWLMAAGAYPGFCSLMRLEVFLLPLDGMLIHRRSLPRNLLGFPKKQSAGTHIYTWVERGTVRVNCLVQEHNKMSQATVFNLGKSCTETRTRNILPLEALNSYSVISPVDFTDHWETSGKTEDHVCLT